MLKAIRFAIPMAGVQALTGEDLRVDPDASNLKVGVVPWNPFYDAYIDGLFAGDDQTPSNFDHNDHLCFWKIIIEQPFVSNVSDRYSYGIVHNCPAEIVTGITFNLTLQTGTDAIIYDDKTSAAGVTVENSTISVTLTAKTEAGEGTGNDFGLWTTLDTMPALSYSYIVNLASSVDEPVQQTEEPVLPDCAELFVDRTKTVEDLDLSGDPTTHESNLRNEFASSGLDQYAVECGEFKLPEDFYGGSLHPWIFAYATQIPSGEVAESGCRRFGFTNGNDSIYTAVLGKNCSGVLQDIVKDESENFGNLPDYQFFEGLKSYPGDHLVTYLHSAVNTSVHDLEHETDFILGASAEDRVGKTLWRTDFDHVFGQRICGLKYYIQTFKEAGKAHYTNYVNWRLLFCVV